MNYLQVQAKEASTIHGGPSADSLLPAESTIVADKLTLDPIISIHPSHRCYHL
jgi:hypothetical protein